MKIIIITGKGRGIVLVKTAISNDEVTDSLNSLAQSGGELNVITITMNK